MRFYENPQKTSHNREKPRSYYIPKGSAEYISLNGKWKFAFFKDSDLFEEVNRWDEIDVPSCWQFYGYETPNYTNINFPFPCDMPYVPDKNPMGVYERSFEIKDMQKEHYLVFEGVTGCAVLYINGKYVGYTQGSHFQAEFKITKYASLGENRVRVYVYKWCCGSYLECQDMFRHNGIFRDVYVLSREKGHIKSIDIKTIDNHKIIVSTDKKAIISLYDKENLIATGVGTNCTFEVENPILWNAEHPYLYKVVCKRGDEIIEQSVGLRTVSVSSKNEILVNGTPIKIKGVNHHDTSLRGFCMTEEELRHDIELMQSLNMNAIRTSHYPPHPKFLEMCDEMGMYVILECDNEAHGFLHRYPNVEYNFDMKENEWPASNPKWKKEHLDRIERTYERDKNHASIIMWSLGNESGYSPICIDPMLDYIREKDKSRLVHYESANWTDEGTKKMDVYSTMYPPISRVIDEVTTNKKNKPIYYCEYSHSIGNGPEDVWAYVDLMHKYPNFTGGCIWEWADHVVMVDGVQKYGGDFEGELTHDSNLCCDGLVFANRGFKAGTYEVKTAFAPFRFDYKNGKLKITNLFDFTSLADYTINYKIRVDENTVEEKALMLDIAPKKSAVLQTTCHPTQCMWGANIDVELINPQGNSMGVLSQPINCKKIKPIKDKSAATLTEEKHFIYARGECFEYRFNKRIGNFDSIKINGEEMLCEPVKLSAFRAVTDNDRRVRHLWTNQTEDKGENLNCQFTKVYSVQIKGNKIIAEMSEAGVGRLPFIKYKQTVSIYKDGRISYSLVGSVREDILYLPRLGYEFKLDKSNKRFEYFGMGPYENYVDICHHVRQDHFKSDSESEYVNYPRPQEHGNHMHTHLLKVENKLKFASDIGFDFNVSSYGIEQLYKANHTDEIGESYATHIRIDYKNTGIGSAYDEKVRFDEKQIKFSFDIELNI